MSLFMSPSSPFNNTALHSFPPSCVFTMTDFLPILLHQHLLHRVSLDMLPLIYKYMCRSPCRHLLLLASLLLYFFSILQFSSFPSLFSHLFLLTLFYPLSSFFSLLHFSCKFSCCEFRGTKVPGKHQACHNRCSDG
jgi:hypothetical protein